MPENADAWELFSACQTQLIVAGLGTIVGVDHTSLAWRMDLLEIPPEERYATDEKFRLIEAVFLRSCAARSSSTSTNPDKRG